MNALEFLAMTGVLGLVTLLLLVAMRVWYWWADR